MSQPLLSEFCRVLISTVLLPAMRAHEKNLQAGSLRGRRLISAVMFAVMVLCASAEAADGPERAEYVNRLESICKPGVEATQKAVKGVRSDIEAERLAVAAGKLGKAAQIFDGTVQKISAVPRPPNEATHLAKW